MRFKDAFELETKETTEDIREEDHPKVLPESNAIKTRHWS